MILQPQLDLLPNVALLRVLVVRIDLDELPEILLRRSDAVSRVIQVRNGAAEVHFVQAAMVRSRAREHERLMEFVLRAQAIETVVGLLST